MIKAVYDVAVVVSNARKSTKWYQEKLGFKVRADEGHWVTVAPKGERTVLHLCERKTLEPGNTGIGFLVDGVTKTFEELEAKGVKFTRTPRDDGWGMYAMFADPDGNEFWLFE